MSGAGLAAAPPARARLGEPAAALEVWAGCTHTVTRAEGTVIGSAPFQRLRRLRQMGLAFHAWPNAENTRASHSLGVAYWSAAYLSALRRAPCPTTRRALDEAAAGLGDLSLEVVLRLSALVHDLDLLPLGHTLRYQSGSFPEAPGRPRLTACLRAVEAHADTHVPATAAPAEQARWTPNFARHLRAAADDDPGRPHARLAAEIVNSALGTDLVDFALRDSAAVGRPQPFPGDLLEGLRLVEADDGWRLALDVGDPATAVRRLELAGGLVRARYEVFAASVFHPVKLAADAMVDLALRRVGPATCAAVLPDDRLLRMGDDELVERLVAAEAAAVAPGDHRVGPPLLAGLLHHEVWRTGDLDGFRRRPDAAAALALDPAWRDDAETALRSRLAWAAPGDVVVGVSPPTMQAKPVDPLLSTAEGALVPLSAAAAAGMPGASFVDPARYRELWSLRVYLAPRHLDRTAEVAAAARALLGPRT